MSIVCTTFRPKKWTVTNVITYNGTYLPMKTLHFQDANIARAQDLEDAKSRLEIAWNGMKCARPPKKGTTIHHFPHDCRKNSGFGGIRVSRLPSLALRPWDKLNPTALRFCRLNDCNQVLQVQQHELQGLQRKCHAVEMSCSWPIESSSVMMSHEWWIL